MAVGSIPVARPEMFRRRRECDVRMVSMKRAAIGAAGIALWLFLFGFVMFASLVMREPVADNSRADGIVVLTGGQTRITEAAKLLKQRRAGRLLISGVNPQTSREQLMKLSGLSHSEFACCVDLGYTALDTVGNAHETRKWTEARGYGSLIVVTSSYHMPRSLTELSRVMPGTRLIPHPVMPQSLRNQAWWLHVKTTSILVSEYLKFLPSAARLTVARVLGSLTTSSIAGAGEGAGAKT